MTADDMLAAIKEEHPRAFAFYHPERSPEWIVYRDGSMQDRLAQASTRWGALFHAYRAVRRSQGKAVFVP